MRGNSIPSPSSLHRSTVTFSFHRAATTEGGEIEFVHSIALCASEPSKFDIPCSIFDIQEPLAYGRQVNKSQMRPSCVAHIRRIFSPITAANHFFFITTIRWLRVSET